MKENLAVEQVGMTIRLPEEILADAQRAAQALQNVVARKKNPVVFRGEHYLEFEDWQTLGRFYGFSTKVEWTRPVEFGNARGFEARAIAVDRNGCEVSAAEAMCLDDEPNWSDRPLFQLRSMAQTRACAKALRNILAWVVVLAGYRPTPAEEMVETRDESPKSGPPPEEKKKGSAKAEFYRTALACGFGTGEKNEKGQALIDFEKLGHWLKEVQLPTDIKKYTDQDFKLAVEVMGEFAKIASSGIRIISPRGGEETPPPDGRGEPGGFRKVLGEVAKNASGT